MRGSRRGGGKVVNCDCYRVNRVMGVGWVCLGALCGGQRSFSGEESTGSGVGGG